MWVHGKQHYNKVRVTISYITWAVLTIITYDAAFKRSREFGATLLVLTWV